MEGAILLCTVCSQLGAMALAYNILYGVLLCLKNGAYLYYLCYYIK